MIWLTWRQQRTETLIALAALALVAALLVPTGLHIASVYHSDGIAACLAQDGNACTLAHDFSGRWNTLVGLTALMLMMRTFSPLAAFRFRTAADD